MKAEEDINEEEKEKKIRKEIRGRGKRMKEEEKVE
jgi:hypothetical protein